MEIVKYKATIAIRCDITNEFSIGILYLTLTNSKGEGQGQGHFDHEYLMAIDMVKILIPSNSKSCMGFPLIFFILLWPILEIMVKVMDIFTGNRLEMVTDMAIATRSRVMCELWF